MKKLWRGTLTHPPAHSSGGQSKKIIIKAPKGRKLIAQGVNPG